MKEVILNDKCMRCKDKECHDGENFCNQAMNDNSFYKNAKLYKGLEVIQRPTYEELEKENAELKKQIDILVCPEGPIYNESAKPREKRIEELENAKLKERLSAIRNAKDKYDMSKDKSVIKAFGAEYTLFCDLERILEDWQEDEQH